MPGAQRTKKDKRRRSLLTAGATRRSGRACAFLLTSAGPGALLARSRKSVRFKRAGAEAGVLRSHPQSRGHVPRGAGLPAGGGSGTEKA